jgi:phosphoribosylformimino-5-aminoimidazole carboxamide ribotide isomerase
MNILPAIDLLDGEAVRLLKGDYGQKTVYGNPIEMARKFKALGVQYLHIVDLNGAREGSPRNFEIIRKISEILPFQVGGGIRNAETVKVYLEIADRVILGTIAAKNPDFVREMVELHGPERIAVGVDVREGKVATEGWLADSDMDYPEYIEKLKYMGVKTIILTDISRDGTLTSPNWEIYKKVSGINVIVSGGVSCDEDVIKARDYYGVIVGKAYYEGKVDLQWLLKNA